MNVRGWWSVLVVGLGLLTPATGQAYCRSTACGNEKDQVRCVADDSNPECSITGQPLAWPSPCVGLSLNRQASTQVPYEEFERVVRASFEAWNQVTCQGEAPSIATTILGPVDCDEVKFNEESGNANIIVFRDEAWPHAGQTQVLALTTLTYGQKTGVIYGADMEIKSQKGVVRLTTSDTNVDIDLQSIITHEAGHLLGLAHSNVTGATMLATYKDRSTEFRTLEQDDIDGLCAAYPPDRGGLLACDPSGPSPRSLGLSGVCGGGDLSPPGDDGCGCRAVAAAPGSPVGSALALGLLVASVGGRHQQA
ncbi:MAG: matrixin family metalloprotease, partial [Myxococcales bacterium]